MDLFSIEFDEKREDEGEESDDDDRYTDVAMKMLLDSIPDPVERKITTKQKKEVFQGEEVSITNLTKQIDRYNSILVLCGAGISVSSGIPDFRSPGSGLYSNLEKFGSNLLPSTAFHINYFKKRPEPRYRMFKIFYEKEYEPTRTHRFINLLDQKKKLLRCYTQNVDGLELKTGIRKEKVIQVHGDIHSAYCVECRGKFDLPEFKKRVFNNKIPVYCGKEGCGGLVKPGVVFFGERVSQSFIDNVAEDAQKCDLLIVIGTSLRVPPSSELVHDVQLNTPRLLMNMELVGPWLQYRRMGMENYRDVAMLGECDRSVEVFCKLCGWEMK